MKLSQLFGLRCRHRHLSRPINLERCCLDCGERFSFDNYSLQSGEYHQFEHYQVRETNVKRVSKTLKWRRKVR